MYQMQLKPQKSKAYQQVLTFLHQNPKIKKRFVALQNYTPLNDLLLQKGLCPVDYWSIDVKQLETEWKLEPHDYHTYEVQIYRKPAQTLTEQQTCLQNLIHDIPYHDPYIEQVLQRFTKRTDACLHKRMPKKQFKQLCLAIIDHQNLLTHLNQMFNPRWYMVSPFTQENIPVYNDCFQFYQKEIDWIKRHCISL